jgi:hypothetical protein
VCFARISSRNVSGIDDWRITGVEDLKGNNLFDLTGGHKREAEPSLVLPFLFYLFGNMFTF